MGGPQFGRSRLDADPPWASRYASYATCFARPGLASCVAAGKATLASSGLKLVSGDSMADAAQKIVKLVA